MPGLVGKGDAVDVGGAGSDLAAIPIPGSFHIRSWSWVRPRPERMGFGAAKRRASSLRAGIARRLARRVSRKAGTVGSALNERSKPDRGVDLLLRGSRFALPVGGTWDHRRLEIKDWSVLQAFWCAPWFVSARSFQCASSLCLRGPIRGSSTQPRGERVTVRPHGFPRRVAWPQTSR